MVHIRFEPIDADSLVQKAIKHQQHEQRQALPAPRVIAPFAASGHDKRAARDGDQRVAGLTLRFHKTLAALRTRHA